MNGDWGQAVAAFDGGRFEEAQALNDQVRQACVSDAPVLPVLATFGADVARMRGKPDEAIALLDAARPADSSRLWPRSQLLYLWAYGALGDEARFKAARDRMLAVNEARMLAGDYWSKQERFETPAAVVDGFRRRTKPGDPDDTLFIATPRNAEMPVSYQQNEGGVAGLVGAAAGAANGRDETGDLNKCDAHASLTPVAASYDSWKTRATTLFSDPATFAQGPEGAGLCQGWPFIFPGLAPAEEEEAAPAGPDSSSPPPPQAGEGDRAPKPAPARRARRTC